MTELTLKNKFEASQTIQMPKRAFLVLGSEGSGTHMMRNALVEAECHWEQWFEEVEIDDIDFMELPDRIVIRRSLPHAGKWPSLRQLIQKLEDADYSIHAIYMVRNFHAAAMSTIRRDYQRDIETCYFNQLFGLTKVAEIIGSYLVTTDFTYVTYEAFCLEQGFRRWLFEQRLGLPYPHDFQIHYANSQYYDG